MIFPAKLSSGKNKVMDPLNSQPLLAKRSKVQSLGAPALGERVEAPLA